MKGKTAKQLFKFATGFATMVLLQLHPVSDLHTFRYGMPLYKIE
jgi:hypothetical protein